MKSVPENIYLQTCSSSFPGAQSASFSTLNSPGWGWGGVKDQELQQHRVQSPQRQMANKLVVVQSLANAPVQYHFIVNRGKESTWKCRRRGLDLPEGKTP